jgi:hypothetical protein|mmetsp:Transcript_41406/g.65606  ORF Transcript_41406/g.65606 Transcript_41406/m.65606 type:complete len:164 (-) Transcript_41406:343-834(-)
MGLEDLLSSFISLGNVDARTQFVCRFVSNATFSSVTCGLVCGQIGAFLPCGPLLPFIGGSWFGYTFACFSFWQREKSRALHYSEKYPRLMEHTLITERQIKLNLPVASWVSSGLGPMSWGILAAQSLSPCVAEVQDTVLEKIKNDYMPEEKETSEDEHVQDSF